MLHPRPQLSLVCDGIVTLLDKIIRKGCPITFSTNLQHISLAHMISKFRPGYSTGNVGLQGTAHADMKPEKWETSAF